jgi:hypothetical protein
MSISVRIPVQIACVRRELDTTEAALTGPLGAKKCVRIAYISDEIRTLFDTKREQA